LKVRGARWSYIWSRIATQPATAFIFLSLAFGSLIIYVLPPLRGPDEISHFLRIYSYARGELLPTGEVDGRKGTFVERELYDQSHFFWSAGELFAIGREQGVRYQQLMALYRDSGGTGGEPDQPTSFAPFAGTEGYNPIAYVPYIAAAAIGRLADGGSSSRVRGGGFPHVVWSKLHRALPASCDVCGSDPEGCETS
jgi:hypothetical protein